MASLHELHTYEVPAGTYEVPAEPYQANSRNELHAITTKKQKPEQAGCSRWIIGCGITMAFIALCVSVATLVLLFTSTGLKSAQLDTSRPTEASHDKNQCGGSTYVRWGRTVCPVTSTLVYAGLVGGKKFEHSGSGSNYLCLPHDPEYDDYVSGVQDLRAFIHSAEYETSDFDPFSSLRQHDPPCAVCHVVNRVSLMFPAKMTCPSGWTREYHGYLMAEYYKHSSTEFVCVDRNPEMVPGSISDKNGALFYATEGRCTDGSLPCSPYIDGAELTCVVCSK